MKTLARPARLSPNRLSEKLDHLGAGEVYVATGLRNVWRALICGLFSLWVVLRRNCATRWRGRRTGSDRRSSARNSTSNP
jgi:hypothetical protein